MTSSASPERSGLTPSAGQGGLFPASRYHVVFTHLFILEEPLWQPYNGDGPRRYYPGHPPGWWFFDYL